MSMHLEFEPKQWFYGFAIRDLGKLTGDNSGNPRGYRWEAYTDDGNHYTIVELEADTLFDLKRQIVEYWWRAGGVHVPVYFAKRLNKSKEIYNV